MKSKERMILTRICAALAVLAFVAASVPPESAGAQERYASNQQYGADPSYDDQYATDQQYTTGQQYTLQEVVDAGHNFFGTTTGALATAIERAFAKYGLPNGYVLGEEAGGAFIGGLRYGEGMLYTKNAGDHKVYWQGPSVGWDYGLEGNRTMMLVYDLPDVDAVYRRYFGVSGSAYLIGGVGMTALTREGVNLVPIHTGVGARLGVNVGYLKMTRIPRINPF